MRRLFTFLLLLVSFSLVNEAYAQNNDVLNIDIAKNASYAIEINKIMEKDGECVVFFISETRTKEANPEFSVDIAMFDENMKIIGDLRSLIVPLQPSREIVSRFSFEDIDCSDISRIHVNKILCSQKDDANSCYEKTAIRSRLNKTVTR